MHTANSGTLRANERNTMEQQNPSIVTDHFLVYGTLRPGCGNYDHFFPYVAHSVQTVRIYGFAMFGLEGFPYAVRAGATDSIECTLITVTDTPDNVRYLTKGLDTLEGYTPNGKYNHYDRITVEVNGLNAHLYVVSDKFRDYHVSGLPQLDSGNWHDAEAPIGGAYMWIYEGEDESIIPDDSVEARFVTSTASYDFIGEEEEGESIYESADYADVYTYPSI